jgi:hypothetical protein
LESKRTELSILRTLSAILVVARVPAASISFFAVIEL